jgi:hypothetical protein
MKNNYDNFQEENFLFGKDKKLPFVLPEGYFDSFSSRLINKIEAEQELADYKMLASLKKPLLLSVPKDYFNSLSDILEYKYEISVYSTLSKTSKPVLKSLPTNYFEGLEKKIIDKMELESELKEFSVLSSIKKQNNFKIASEYFDNSAEETKEKIHIKSTNQPTVFRQLVASLFRPQMAIAASLVILIGLSALWYFNRHTDEMITPSGDCHTLACLEKNEILNEKNIQNFDDENLYEMVDADALDKKMNTENKTNDSSKIKSLKK